MLAVVTGHASPLSLCCGCSYLARRASRHQRTAQSTGAMTGQRTVTEWHGRTTVSDVGHDVPAQVAPCRHRGLIGLTVAPDRPGPHRSPYTVPPGGTRRGGSRGEGRRPNLPPGRPGWCGGHCGGAWCSARAPWGPDGPPGSGASRRGGYSRVGSRRGGVLEGGTEDVRAPGRSGHEAKGARRWGPHARGPGPRGANARRGHQWVRGITSGACSRRQGPSLRCLHTKSFRANTRDKGLRRRGAFRF